MYALSLFLCSYGDRATEGPLSRHAFLTGKDKKWVGLDVEKPKDTEVDQEAPILLPDNQALALAGPPIAGINF